MTVARLSLSLGGVFPLAWQIWPPFLVGFALSGPQLWRVVLSRAAKAKSPQKQRHENKGPTITYFSLCVCANWAARKQAAKRAKRAQEKRPQTSPVVLCFCFALCSALLCSACLCLCLCFSFSALLPLLFCLCTPLLLCHCVCLRSSVSVTWAAHYFSTIAPHNYSYSQPN